MPEVLAQKRNEKLIKNVLLKFPTSVALEKVGFGPVHWSMVLVLSHFLKGFHFLLHHPSQEGCNRHRHGIACPPDSLSVRATI